MPVISVRVSEELALELAAEAAGRGVSPSQVVRDAVASALGRVGLEDRVEGLERRLGELERMAGVS